MKCRILHIFYCIVFLSVLGSSFNGIAQTYNNEWIDYSKTYYKFKVAKTGIYHINFSNLVSVGINTIPARQFQLWHNGKEIPLYIPSDSNSSVGINSYIEFFGERNDGTLDSSLYREKDKQLSTYWSLETDSATYFLCINPSGGNKRYQTKGNISSNVTSGQSQDAYFSYTTGYYPKDALNWGRASTNYGSAANYIYASSYDLGEGWTTGDIATGGSGLTIPFNNLYAATNGSNANVSATVFGVSGNGIKRTISLKLNNQLLDSKQVNVMTAGILENNSISPSLLAGSPQFTISGVTDSLLSGEDRFVIAKMQVTYSRLFNFSDANGTASRQFVFVIDPKATGNFFQISGLNTDGDSAILYDYANNERYLAAQVNNQYSFYLPPTSNKRTLIAYSKSTSAFNTLDGISIEKKTFVDYKTTNQGDFLIITNKSLRNGTAIESYRAYRASTQGGGHNAKIYNIDQLEDQFSFGIKRHPNSIRAFLKYAREQFTTLPKNVLLIGRGITYNRYYEAANNPSTSADIDQINLVPTFGYPASDVLLSSNDLWPIATTPIGRLAVTSEQQLQDYLSKLQVYESTAVSNTIADKLWMKNVVNIAGGYDEAQSNIFIYYLDQYEYLLKGSYYGAINYEFNKYSNSTTTELTDVRLGKLFQTGIGLINYYGHASATSLDFNLSDPSAYQNEGKYPVFYTSGCDIGDYFDYTRDMKIPEKYVLEPGRGAIAFIAQSYLGLSTFLHNFNVIFFKNVAKDGYGKSLSVNQQAAATGTIKSNFPYFNDSIATEAQAAQNIIFGDPAICMHTFSKPDYAIESSSVSITPSYLSVSESSYSVKIKVSNLGRAVDDSVLLQVQRISSSGVNEIIFSKRIGPVYSEDSVTITVPILAARDKGQGYLNITIDPNNEIDEITKTNNNYRQNVYIYESGIIPVFPYNYSIVRTQKTLLTASTASPIAPLTSYIMQMDTTKLFNSSLRITKMVKTTGGVVSFDPQYTYKNNTVYYWRVAAIPTNGDTIWGYSSFLFLTQATSHGFNQSHVYQHLESSFDGMYMDSASRSWKFDVASKSLQVIHTIFPNNLAAFRIILNGNEVSEYWCGGYKIVFNVFQYGTLLPYYNSTNPTVSELPNGTDNTFAGSNPTSKDKCVYVFYSGGDVATNFEFDASSAAGRNAAYNFMNWIPDKSSVVVRLFYDNQQGNSGTGYDPSTWVADRQVNGNNNTLYDALKNAGFTTIDSYTPAEQKAFTFIYNKNLNNSAFPAITNFSTVTNPVTTDAMLPIQGSDGTVMSPKFGPALKWHTVLWDGNVSKDGANGNYESTGDQFSVSIFGVDKIGNETFLHTMPISEKSWDASGVSAATYPYLRLKMSNEDTVHYTPYQMSYWRILYDAVPDGALSGNLYFHESQDSIHRGEGYKMGIAFKNISDVAFADSILVNYSIIDKNNVTHAVLIPSLKPLNPGDTAHIEVAISGVNGQGSNAFTSLNLGGSNVQNLIVNPDFAQPEQTLVNNILSKELYVHDDANSQNLDVTFDGIHILNNDIINPAPKIVIRFRDESKYLLLKDSSAISIKLQYPDGTLKDVYYVMSGDSLTFLPAKDSVENTAISNFNPLFTQNGTYRLLVFGKNPLDPTNSNVSYSVSFQVITDSRISDVFNYPNPFTTSTAFVFTLTGTHIPQNIRIQIMTITGKIVKDITKDELGDLKIGRNITDYKWDGRDQYGQRLANGVYLYRIITNDNGKALEKYQPIENGKNIDTGKYFKSGYGKMFLMR